MLGGFGQGGLEGSIWQPNGGRTILSIASLLLFTYSMLLLPFYLELYKRLNDTGRETARVGVFLGVAAAVLSSAVSTAVSSVTLGLATRYGLDVTGQDGEGVSGIVEGILRFSGGLLDAETRLRAISLLAIGAALLKAAAFRRWHGWMSMIVGILFLSLTMATPFISIPFLYQILILKEILFVLWLVIVGFRVFRISRTTS